MKKIKKGVTLLILGYGIASAQAQQSTTTSGGDALGSGGSVSYSLGQIVYTTQTSTIGSILQGVEQPYEISIVLGTEDHQINHNIEVYPNPTTDYLILTIGNINPLQLSFQLIDLNGKLIENKKITNTTETIRMDNLPSTIYFLRVTNNNKEIKTFKIIKK